MAALFVGDSQIATSLLPLNAMRQNPAAAGTKLRENMSKFVAKCAIDLCSSVITKSRI